MPTCFHLVDSGTTNGLDYVKHESVVDGVESSVCSTIEANAASERSSNGLQDNESSNTCDFLPEMVNLHVSAYSLST